MHGPDPQDRDLSRIDAGYSAPDVQDSKDFRHRPAGRFEQRPASALFRNLVEKRDLARNIGANYGITDAVERDLSALLLLKQHFFHDLAFNSVAQRPMQAARFYLALDE